MATASTFYTFDPSGNVAQRLDGEGNVLGAYAFDAFGLRTGTDSTTDPYAGFGGGYGYYADAETGLSLLGHRYYDMGTGRFVTRDPIGYDGGINLYAYAGNNPINEDDPSGFMPGLALAGGGIFTGGAAAGGEGLAALGTAAWPVALGAAVLATGYGLGTGATWVGNHIANGFHPQDGLPARPMNIGKAIHSPRQLGLPTGEKCPFPYIPPKGWKPGNELPGISGKNGPQYRDSDGNYWRQGPDHHFPGDNHEWDVQLKEGGHINVGRSGGDGMGGGGNSGEAR